MENGLKAERVVYEIFELLNQRNQNILIRFKEPKAAEVADDSDSHRSRYGFMLYKEARIFNFDKRRWAVFFGDETSGYPAEGYLRDLSAIEIKEEFNSENDVENGLTKLIRKSNYFVNSLIHADSSGLLITSTDSRFYGDTSYDPREFIATKEEFDSEGLVFLSVLKRPRTYKPEIIPKLTETIENVLRNHKDR